MNKLFFLIFALSAFSVAAQNRSNSGLTNFDTPNGVVIYVKPVEPPIKIVKNSKKNQVQQNQINKPKIQPTVLQRLSGGASLKMSVGKTLGSFSTGNANVDNFIVTSATRNNVDPLLVYATMSQESNFKPTAMSYKGARGLMQLMPGTAARFGVTNIFDPQQNIEGGIRYLRWLLNTFNGDVKLALAGYNAGEGAVMKYGYTIPPYAETQNYVQRISARYEMLRNPNYAKEVIRAAVPAYRVEVVNVNTNKVVAPPAPPLYELNAMPIRLPNGKIQLVTQ